MKQVLATVIENSLICPDMRPQHGEASSHLIWLQCPEIAAEARPGQFVMVRCGSEFILRRPLSIHRVSGDNIALFFVAWKNRGTWWLARREENESVDLLGPLGNGFTIHSDLEHMLLMAGGMGIAPIVFLANAALERSKKVTLLRGVRYSVQLLPDELLPRGITIITATEDGERGHKGRVSELIPDYIESASQIFACGPTPMYRDMANKYHPFLKDKSVQVSLEVRMGCGLGVCYGCTVNTKRGLRQVCKDGPIFNLEDILWDELAYNY